jgi:phage/plasmid-like protein (TIGR03299 family)
MSHGITENDTMVSGRNVVPWHSLGTVVKGTMTAEECIKLGGLDWPVEIEEIKDVRGNVIPERFAVTRKDKDLVLEIVGNRYHPIQNRESFGFFDEVIGKNQAFYETAGSLWEGRKVWIMASLPGNLFVNSNPDDKSEKWVLLHTSHDGSASLTLQLVAVRVVCQNTLSAALSSRTNVIKIRHTENAKKRVCDAQKVLELASAYFDDLQGLMNKLSEVPMNKDEMVKFTEQLLPAKDEAAAAPTRLLNTRQAIVGLFDRGAGNAGKSRWDALNAVTDFVDHERGLRGETSRFESAILGSGANLKQRAVDLLAA